MARAAAHYQDVFVARQPFDNEIAVRGVLVLAYAALDQWGSGEIGEAPRQIFARQLDHGRREAAVLAVWIDLGPVPVKGDLEALVLEIGQAVGDVARIIVRPYRPRGPGETGIARPAAELHDFLAGGDR